MANKEQIGVLLVMVEQVQSALDTLKGQIVSMGESDAPPPVVVVPPPVEAITHVVLEDMSGALQNDVPFTFGQVFAKGDLAADSGLAGREGDDIVPLQVDVKALHDDGSVRHAIISGILPTLLPLEKAKLELIPAKAGTAAEVAPGAEWSHARVTVTVGGIGYWASLNELLNADSSKKWLYGQVVQEFHVSTPLLDKANKPHPHLAARFALRVYPDAANARIDITIENNWAYEPNPSNLTYDLTIVVDGKVVIDEKNFTHYHHARRREVFWLRGDPGVHVRHDARYLIDTGALANYDPAVVVSEKKLQAVADNWKGDRIKPMAAGSAMRGMPTTGGREDIGLLPGWAVRALLSQDPRAKMEMLGTADLAGSWSMHYRDEDTGQPISIVDYPYMTILGRSSDTMNPKTKKYEAFPAVDKGSTTPLTHDSSHQPNFAYLPYIVTGDHYSLEELQFWAMWNMLSMNPGYREREKGLVWRNQVRAQAWNLRSIAEAAYITPDADRLKSHFAGFVKANLDWYNATYTDNPNANKLGILDNPGAFAYQNGNGIAPWQDDFFTQVVGHVADLGFDGAQKLLTWKGKFVIERMVGEGAKPVFGAAYSMVVKKPNSSVIFPTIAEVLDATPEVLKGDPVAVAQALKLKVGEMTGHSSSAIGYPSNEQPSVSYAADYLGARGLAAWDEFMKNPVKPDYSSDPQFAVVPRSKKG